MGFAARTWPCRVGVKASCVAEMMFTGKPVHKIAKLRRRAFGTWSLYSVLHLQTEGCEDRGPLVEATLPCRVSLPAASGQPIPSKHNAPTANHNLLRKQTRAVTFSCCGVLLLKMMQICER